MNVATYHGLKKGKKDKAKDVVTQKMTNIRTKWFLYHGRESKTCLDFVKARFADKEQFYTDVKVRWC